MLIYVCVGNVVYVGNLRIKWLRLAARLRDECHEVGLPPTCCSSALFVITRMWPLVVSRERHLGDANDADDAIGLGWWRARSRRMDFFFPFVSAGALDRRRKLKRGDRGAREVKLCADDLFGVVMP